MRLKPGRARSQSRRTAAGRPAGSLRPCPQRTSRGKAAKDLTSTRAFSHLCLASHPGFWLQIPFFGPLGAPSVSPKGVRERRPLVWSTKYPLPGRTIGPASSGKRNRCYPQPGIGGNTSKTRPYRTGTTWGVCTPRERKLKSLPLLSKIGRRTLLNAARRAPHICFSAGLALDRHTRQRPAAVPYLPFSCSAPTTQACPPGRRSSLCRQATLLKHPPAVHLSEDHAHLP